MIKFFNLQLFADESAQEPSIPAELQGMDKEFVEEVMAENESLNAEPSVTGQEDLKPDSEPVKPTQEPTEPPKQEPDYKQMYENMQRALKEEREKNRQPQQQPQQQEQEQDDLLEQQAIEKVKKALEKKGVEFNEFDLNHQTRVSREVAKMELAQYQQQQQVFQQQSTYQQFVQPYTARSDIQELYAFAQQKYQSLPPHEKMGVDYAEQTQNVAVLKPLYDKIVGEFDAIKQAQNNENKKLEQIANHPRANQVKGGGGGASVDYMALAEDWDNLSNEQKKELEKLTNKIT